MVSARLGPAIVRGLNYPTLRWRTRVNNELRHDSPTSELIYSSDKLLSYISQFSLAFFSTRARVSQRTAF